MALTQAEGLQRTPLSTNAHAPLRQAPVVPHVEDSVVVHLPWGSGAPSGTALHNPAELAKLHAMHEPVQAPSQHTPWAQKPDWHSLLSLQSVPFGLSPQELLRQKLPSLHCESLVHDPKHALPLHLYGLHVRVRDSIHWPVALHVAGGWYVPGTQLLSPPQSESHFSSPQVVPGA